MFLDNLEIRWHTREIRHNLSNLLDDSCTVQLTVLQLVLRFVVYLFLEVISSR